MKYIFCYKDNNGKDKVITTEDERAPLEREIGGVEWDIGEVVYKLNENYEYKCEFKNTADAIEAIAQAFDFLTIQKGFINLTVGYKNNDDDDDEEDDDDE